MLHLRTLFVQLYSCSGTTLLKPAHRRMICDPPPPKEFHKFSLLRALVFLFRARACCTPESDSLPPPRKASLRAPVGLGGPLPSFAHFLYKGPNLLAVLYPPVTSSSFSECCWCGAWAGGCTWPGPPCSEQGAELSLRRGTRQRVGAAAVWANCSLAG